MIRLFVFLGSLLLLALIGALAVPPFVNWSQFNDRFEQEASRILGHKVEVLGETSARLLPLPSVTFGNLRVGEADDGQPLLTAKSFHLDMELAPLMKGEIVVVDMILDKPRLEMTINQRGAMAFPGRVESSMGEFRPEDISIDNITISDGVVRVRDIVSTHEVVIKGIDFNASAKTLAGPWNVRGALSYLNDRVQVAGTGGRWQEADGTARMSVRFNAKPKSQPYDLEFDGPFSLNNGVPRLEGLFRLKKMGQQSAEERISFARPARAEALDIDVQGAVKITAKGAIVPQFKLDVGDKQDPYVIGGSGFANFGEEVSFQVTAEGQQINLERFETEEPVEGAGPKTLMDRLASVRAVLERIPRFDAEGRIFLNLPAVVAGDTVVRDVDIEARPVQRGTGWRINNLQAQLPGRTELRADGTLTLGDKFGYQGGLVLASNQPSGFAAWLSDNVPAVISNLPTAGLSATATINEQSVKLDNLEIVLAGQQLLGSFKRDAALNGDKPQIQASLSGKEVNYDQLAALLDVVAGKKGSASEHDIALDLKADVVRAFGLKADQVETTLSVANGWLDLKQLTIGTLAGSTVSLSGQLTGFPEKPEGQLAGGIKATNFARLLELVQSRFGPFPLLDRFISEPSLAGETDLAFDIKAGSKSIDGGIEVSIGGFSGGSTLQFAGQAEAGEQDLAKREVKATLTLNNNDGSKLLAQLGVPTLPVQDAGKGGFSASVNGRLSSGLTTKATIDVATLAGAAAGVLKLGQENGVWTTDGNLAISAKTTDFDPLILLSGLPLPGFGEGRQGNISLTLNVEGDELGAQNVLAKIGDSTWRGDLVYNRGTKPRPSVQGTLSTDQIDVMTLPSLVYTSMMSGDAFAQTGNVENIETTRGSVPIFAGTDGRIDFKASTVFLPDGANNVSDLQGKLVLRDGDIALENFSSNLLSGRLSGDISLGQSSAAQLINGQLNLEQADLQKLAVAMGYDIAVNGKINLSGNFESAGANTKSLIAGLTGSGSAIVSEGTLGGLNEDALKTIMAISDQRSRDAEVMNSKELAEAGLFDGTFAFERTEAAVSIASGVARANNIRLASQKASVVANMRLNFDDFALSSNARIAYSPGRESVVGASPGVSVDVELMPGKVSRTFDPTSLTTFLGMRSAEQREREFESQKANILERQRLQRMVRLYDLQERRRQQEAERLRLEEERLRLEEETKLERQLQEEQKRLLREQAAEQLRLQEREQEATRQREDRLREARLKGKKKKKLLKIDEEPVLKDFDVLSPTVLDALRDRVRDSLSTN